MVKGKPKKVSKEKPKKKVVAKEKPVDKKKDSLEENLSEDLPLEIVEGITDSLEQVDVRSLLRHSGEEEQKTRAHLEEELGDAPWVSQEEDKREITYGGIEKDSAEKKSYLENGEENQNTNSLDKLYETINPYSTTEGQQQFYDAEHERVKDEGQIGDIRTEDRSQLEIQGLTGKADMRAGGTMEGHRQNENYE